MKNIEDLLQFVIAEKEKAESEVNYWTNKERWHAMECSEAAMSAFSLIEEQIIQFKNSENTTIVSDARTKSGVLHDVGESHANGQTDNDSLASGELPLEKITEAKEYFFCEDYDDGKDKCDKQCPYCSASSLLSKKYG